MSRSFLYHIFSRFCALLTSRYQVSVYRTNGPLVFNFCHRLIILLHVQLKKDQALVIVYATFRKGNDIPLPLVTFLCRCLGPGVDAVEKIACLTFHQINLFRIPGALARSAEMLLQMQEAPQSILASGTFREDLTNLPESSSADSRRVEVRKWPK